MITLRKMDNSNITINCDFIITIEANPDTVITLSTGKKLIVKDTIEEITDLIIDYKRQIFDTIEK
ncbi:MAG TPA: flagellar FlbD family protein [Clostridiales bacterium]|nr:flagellar FlbD family protein [Clostridiales bacterium]